MVHVRMREQHKVNARQLGRAKGRSHQPFRAQSTDTGGGSDPFEEDRIG
jgi:hypothetical protein